jgi:hypothetical protein
MPDRTRGSTRREPRAALARSAIDSDGTLDWGYIQINTVHLKRAGVSLRGLLDCQANIDFAHQRYTQKGFQPWSTFNSGAYPQKLLIEAALYGRTRIVLLKLVDLIFSGKRRKAKSDPAGTSQSSHIAGLRLEYGIPVLLTMMLGSVVHKGVPGPCASSMRRL